VLLQSVKIKCGNNVAKWCLKYVSMSLCSWSSGSNQIWRGCVRNIALLAPLRLSDASSCADSVYVAQWQQAIKPPPVCEHIVLIITHRRQRHGLELKLQHMPLHNAFDKWCKLKTIHKCMKKCPLFRSFSNDFN